MKTSNIISTIYADFTKHYLGRGSFVNSGHLWDFCMEIIKNPLSLSLIVYKNNQDVPPVKTLLEFYAATHNPAPSFTLSEQECKDIGSLMGFVFQFVLGYQKDKMEPVNMLGCKEASVFTKITESGEVCTPYFEFCE